MSGIEAADMGIAVAAAARAAMHLVGLWLLLRDSAASDRVAIAQAYFAPRRGLMSSKLKRT